MKNAYKRFKTLVLISWNNVGSFRKTIFNDSTLSSMSRI